MLGSVVLDGDGLARTPDDRTHHVAGQQAGLVDHLPVADHVVDAQVAGDRFDLVGHGRGTQDDGVPPALVRPHDLAHLGVHQIGDVLLEKPLAELLEFVGAASA